MGPGASPDDGKHPISVRIIPRVIPIFIQTFELSVSHAASLSLLSPGKHGRRLLRCFRATSSFFFFPSFSLMGFFSSFEDLVVLVKWFGRFQLLRVEENLLNRCRTEPGSDRAPW